MPAGRPRKPTALKKLEGTYRKDRDSGKEIAEKKISAVPGVIIPPDSKVSCPKTIKTKYVRSYWKRLTNNLISMQVLSYNDLPQLENMMLILEKLREAQEHFSEYSFSDAAALANYDICLKIVSKLTQMFNDLAAKYYISPSARSKLTLDLLNIQKTSQEIEKNASGVDKLMALRNRNK
jgi:phage terminase small subunit